MSPQDIETKVERKNLWKKHNAKTWFTFFSWTVLEKKAINSYQHVCQILSSQKNQTKKKHIEFLLKKNSTLPLPQKKTKSLSQPGIYGFFFAAVFFGSWPGKVGKVASPSFEATWLVVFFQFGVKIPKIFELPPPRYMYIYCINLYKMVFLHVISLTFCVSFPQKLRWFKRLLIMYLSICFTSFTF